jgi:multiple sugar transport system substrate-binding protein
MARRLAARAVLALVLLGAGAGACAQLVVRHALWDANQRPLYQRCASAFEAENPGLRVRLQQIGWDDYWTSLATGFISNTAPDVFTNHVAKYSEFVLNGVVVDLTPLIARDRLDVDIYEPGLLQVWQHQGRQYALPSDWDTVALLVNVPMLRAAGLDQAQLRQLTWNPRDGGSFGRVIARLTIDESGRRADEPGFDPNRIRVHGFQMAGSGGMMGQTQWSSFAVSNGWRFQDRPWDPNLRYDDPRLVATLEYFARLPRSGVSAAPERMGRLGAGAMFMSGRAAMTVDGSWMMGHMLRHTRFEHAWLPLPLGPAGHRASMLNGLALSIWSGSRNREAAWRWVRYAGSRACQAQVAPAGVVFPAVRGLAEEARKALLARGADASAFIEAAQGVTFSPPIAPRAAEITDLMNAAVERVLSGRVSAQQAMTEATARIRDITRKP